LRIGELKHLTWDDVDYGNNVLHIRPKDGWKPKTGDQRAVPMSPRVRSLIEKLPRRSKWIMTAPASPKYPNGDHQVSERRLLLALKGILKKLGLRGHLHTFRHAFISAALMSGIPEAVVRAWVGHVDADVIRLYTHIHDADSQAAMRRLTANLDGSK
jgi:integrase